MTEAEWFAERNTLDFLMFIQHRRLHRKWDLFSSACFRRIWFILQDQRIRDYIDVMEKSADGDASDDKVEVVWTVCEAAFLENPNQFPYSWFAHEMSEYPMQFDPLDVAKACREAAGVVAGEALRPKGGDWTEEMSKEWRKAEDNEETEQHRLIDDIFGNPFRPVTINSSWLTSTVVTLANQMYKSRDFSAMPILADALQDASCDNETILNHCRGPGPHVKGCWVVDLLTNRE